VARSKSQTSGKQPSAVAGSNGRGPAPTPAASRTDAVLYWNDVALEANRVSHTNGKGEQTGPTLSSRALAIVHLAMYDAFAAVSPSAETPPYLTGLPPAPAGASARAAVSGAAHQALSALFPGQRPFFDARLGQVGDPIDPGHDFGVAVARAILLDRAGDPPAGDAGYHPSDARGRHRVDPDNAGQGFHAPFYGARCKLFSASARHALDAPPIDDAEYLTALREVRGLGIVPELTSTLPEGLPRRTPEQTMVGVYWGYDGAPGLGTPPRLFNQIVRQVALAQGNTEARNARLFALVNVAMADAGILAWEQKFAHDFWRPVVAIREHATSTGPAASQGGPTLPGDADPGWLPLGAPSSNSMNQNFVTQSAATFPYNQAVVGRLKNFTPPFPAYPSGHATFGAAALHVTRLFYGQGGRHNQGSNSDLHGDQLFDGLSLVSEEFDGFNQDNRGAVRPRVVRTFPNGLLDMIVENGRSRVYLGVHWVFDAFAVDDDGDPDFSRRVGGVPLGFTIAEDIFDRGMSRSDVGPASR